MQRKGWIGRLALTLVLVAGARPAVAQQAPWIRIFFVTGPRFRASGGNAIIQAFVKDDVQVNTVSASVTRPDGHTSSAKLTLFQPPLPVNHDAAIWQIIWPIPANTVTDSAIYVVKEWMVDAQGLETRAQPANIVVLGAPPAGSIIKPPPKH